MSKLLEARRGASTSSLSHGAAMVTPNCCDTDRTARAAYPSRSGKLGREVDSERRLRVDMRGDGATAAACGYAGSGGSGGSVRVRVEEEDRGESRWSVSSAMVGRLDGYEMDGRGMLMRCADCGGTELMAAGADRGLGELAAGLGNCS